MGVTWRDPLKRKNLVRKLSINGGVFTYDLARYSSQKYTAEHLCQAQKESLLLCNTKIPLDAPVHLGLPGVERVCRKNESYKVGNYKTIMEANRQTDICVNHLVYGIFSDNEAYQNWYMLSDQNLDFKNKAHLTTLETPNL